MEEESSMIRAIEMFFDKKADASIRSIWRDLYDSRLPSYMHKSERLPHISLTVFNQLNVDDCIKRLSKFAELGPLRFTPCFYEMLRWSNFKNHRMAGLMNSVGVHCFVGWVTRYPSR